jgi:hypothetical protein
MENQSSKIKWILGISVLFIAFLGVGAGIGISLQNGNEDVIPNISDALGIGDVSLSARESEITRDTEVGTVDINVDIYCYEDLPLCLTIDYIREKWTATAAISGYDLNYTVIIIEQKGETVGYAYVDWGEARRERCWTDYYTGTFYLLNADLEIVDYLPLGSSYFPVDSEPLCDKQVPGGLIPGKEVYLTEWSVLRGCESEDQHFYLGGCVQRKLVEMGRIEVDYNIPDPMDLCLTADDLAEWTGTMNITGYEPVDGTIEVWQKGELLVVVNVEWTHDAHGKCYWDTYTATFTMAEDYVAIYSNQWPNGAIQFGTIGPDALDMAEEIPEKEVILKPVNTYKGCDEPNQMFLKIMAHKIRIPRVPNSE